MKENLFIVSDSLIINLNNILILEKKYKYDKVVGSYIRGTPPPDGTGCETNPFIRVWLTDLKFMDVLVKKEIEGLLTLWDK